MIFRFPSQMPQTPTIYSDEETKENWTKFVDENRFRDMTIVASDGSDYQIDYLNRRYVDGLVGQLPYDFGGVSAELLYQLKMRVPCPSTFTGQTSFPTPSFPSSCPMATWTRTC